MKKHDLSFVFAPHGGFNANLHDHLFDTIVPGYFGSDHGDHLNVMGLENAGGLVAERRNALFEAAFDHPDQSLFNLTELSFSHSVEGLFVLLGNLLRMLSSHWGLGYRQLFLLWDYNRRNRNGRILPFSEAHRDESTRREIVEFIERTRGRFNFHGSQDLTSRQVATRFRDAVQESYHLTDLRDDHWVEQLELLPSVAGALMSRARVTRLRVLVTLGHMHRDLAQKARERLQNLFKIHDDIFLPSEAALFKHGNDSLFYQEKHGQRSLSDADHFRCSLFALLMGDLIERGMNQQASHYTIDDQFSKELWDWVQRLPDQLLDEIFEYSGSMQGFKGRKRLPLEAVIRQVAPGRFPDISTILHCADDRPSNQRIDTMYIVTFLACNLGCQDLDDPIIQILEEAVKALEQEGVIARRDLKMRIYNGIEKPTEDTVIKALYRRIAQENPQTTTLWNDTSDGKSAGVRLVTAIKQLLN